MRNTAVKTDSQLATSLQFEAAAATNIIGVPHDPQEHAPGASEGQDQPCVASQSLPTHQLAGGQAARSSSASKQNLVIARLKTPRGATLAKLMEITGWQKHTVRGFLSAVVRKKLDLPLISETGKDGSRRYRIAKAGEGSCA